MISLGLFPEGNDEPLFILSHELELGDAVFMEAFVVALIQMLRIAQPLLLLHSEAGIATDGRDIIVRTYKTHDWRTVRFSVKEMTS